MTLTGCGGTTIENNCSTGADCGRDHRGSTQSHATDQGKVAVPSTGPSTSVAPDKSPTQAAYSLVYEGKQVGLSLPDCAGGWYADFEERTSKFYSDDDLSNMESQAANTGQQLPLDFYYRNCAWGGFGSQNPWSIVSEEPASPTDCADAAKSGGMDTISLAPVKNEGRVKPGATLICTITDAGVAFLKVKEFGPEASSMRAPASVALDVTLWKQG
ncbi:hypothetical protein ACOZCI_20500 [Streptomyces griseoincarnatus]